MPTLLDWLSKWKVGRSGKKYKQVSLSVCFGALFEECFCSLSFQNKVWEKNMTVCHKPVIVQNKSEDFTQACLLFFGIDLLKWGPAKG